MIDFCIYVYICTYVKIYLFTLLSPSGDLHIYRSLPHTFVSFPHWHILPEVEAALCTTVRFLRSVCAGSAAGGYSSRSESLTSINSDLDGGAYNYPDLASLAKHVDSGALDGVMK